ncbi:MAG: NAD-dependent DNA ligase LigA [Eubacteriales bacterium]
MQELINILNEASKAYYQEADEIMSNYEYDKLYDELVELERASGITKSDSPTIHVGYEILSELPKEQHASPMLSLDKTKEVASLQAFLGNQEALISWKLDGLTIVLTYENGELSKAVTRGNGEIGEVITNNAKQFKNLPLTIPCKERVVLRGEAVIGYEDFDAINAEIEEIDAKYKNPRNLCSGSVRQLNSEITAKRHVRFFAFNLVEAEEIDYDNARRNQFEWLKTQGFEVVEYRVTNQEKVVEDVAWFAQAIEENPYPSDGLVLVYDDIAYGQSLGRTAKFPRDSFAFKWEDEIKETTLLEIEWSASRTGLINPVAIFEPVELEGTTVSRASVHNISIVEELELGIGDRITVYKANMIIPQIAENRTRSNKLEIPHACPVCDGETVIKQDGNAKVLYCTNPECEAKKIKSLALFVSRNALNIEGLSEATLEKFVAQGYIKNLVDIFHLEQYAEAIKGLEGFGEKSYDNLQQSVEKARTTTLPKVIYSLGIANIGLANAKMICKAFANDVEKIIHATTEELSAIDGVGDVIAEVYVSYFADEKHVEELRALLQELIIPEEKNEAVQNFAGMNFVITGSVVHYKNRNEIKEMIEQRGGKVTGSVTSKTNYLINNDVASTSSKNKKARDLEVPIISEEDFIRLLEQ